MPDLTAPAAREDAMAAFQADIYAETSKASLAFKWRTITRMFAAWGVELYPPTVWRVHLLGASLKAGGYRSAAGYISLYRTAAGRHGHAFGPE